MHVFYSQCTAGEHSFIWKKKKKAWKLQGWVLIQVLPFLAVSACLLENGVFPHPVRSEDKK